MGVTVGEMRKPTKEEFEKLCAEARANIPSGIDYSDAPKLTEEQRERLVPGHVAFERWQERQKERKLKRQKESGFPDSIKPNEAGALYELRFNIALNIAKNLLDTDLTPEQIARATDLDVRQVEALAAPLS